LAVEHEVAAAGEQHAVARQVAEEVILQLGVFASLGDVDRNPAGAGRVELGPAMVSGHGLVAGVGFALAVREGEADVPARGDAGGSRECDEQRMEVGAISLADLEAVRDVAEPPSRYALVVLPVI